MNALLDDLRQHCGADRLLSEPTDLNFPDSPLTIL
jgi:hypothetical protein